MTLNDPFATHPPVPSFTVTSTTLDEGDTLGLDQMSGIFGVPGGKDVSPQLSWSGRRPRRRATPSPSTTPTRRRAAGFCHWAVAALPADCTDLPENAGDDDGPGLPPGAIQYRNDAGGARFLGAAPPPGHPAHRYFINVYALDTADLGVPAERDGRAARLQPVRHTIARAQMIVMAGGCPPSRPRAVSPSPAP